MDCNFHAPSSKVMTHFSAPKSPPMSMLAFLVALSSVMTVLPFARFLLILPS